MKTLNFILWKPEGTPEFSSGGATFTDGTTIELACASAAYVQEKNLSLEQVSFTIALHSASLLLASHTFKMDKLGGATNLWLLANPKESNINGSFTSKFLQVLCNLPPTQTPLIVKVGVVEQDNTTWVSEGNLVFNGTVGNKQFQHLLTFYDNVHTSRAEANKATTEAYDQKRAEEAQSRHNANHFEVFFKSSHPSQTTYVICKDLKSASENIVEIQPNAKVSMEFWRGSQHEILAYSQNVPKEAAHKVTTVNETLENQEILV